MAYEDLTTFTETDPDSTITVTSARSSFVDLTRDSDAYVYKDKGVNHFSGDYEHLVTVYMDAWAWNGMATIWGLANVIDDWYAIYNSTDIMHQAELYHSEATGENRIVMKELTNEVAGENSDLSVISLDTIYYLKIKRDEAVGANGTLYCYIYDDAARTSLVDTLTVALDAKDDFRYLYATQSRNQSVTADRITGYCENFDLQEAAALSIPVAMHHYKQMWRN